MEQNKNSCIKSLSVLNKSKVTEYHKVNKIPTPDLEEKAIHTVSVFF